MKLLCIFRAWSLRFKKKVLFENIILILIYRIQKSIHRTLNNGVKQPRTTVYRLSINSRSHSTIFSRGFAFRLSIYLHDLQEGLSCLRDCEFCTYPYAQFTYCSITVACVHVALAYLMLRLSQLLMSALLVLIFLLCWRPYYCPCTLLASLLLLAFVMVLTFLL
jgi:hypothetical protein